MFYLYNVVERNGDVHVSNPAIKLESLEEALVMCESTKIMSRTMDSTSGPWKGTTNTFYLVSPQHHEDMNEREHADAVLHSFLRSSGLVIFQHQHSE